MENTPSLDCTPSTLAIFAFSASNALYRTMDTFQSPPASVRDILRGLRALMEVLGPLSDTCGTAIDIDLAALRFILSRCGIACNEFMEEIRKHLPCLDDGSVSPQGLARLRFEPAPGPSLVELRYSRPSTRLKMSLDSLPTELIIQILHHVPVLDYYNLRLAGSRLEGISEKEIKGLGCWTL
jgi:hypothetical protein